MSNINIIKGDSCIELKNIGDKTVDLTVTSPPYDNLRSYSELDFDKFMIIAKELYRVTKDGGVVVWVVGDATIDGSETCTSFKQAIYFREIGFNLHDTMIYRKKNFIPLTHNRYEQEFEYMFVLSKGTPKTFNPIKVACKEAGRSRKPTSNLDKKQSVRPRDEVIYCSDYKFHGNIFEYAIGLNKTGHPAAFPEQLANDQILTWSNKGDVVLDPFMGGGTTGAVAKSLDRDFIGIEIDDEYFEIAKNNIEYGIKMCKNNVSSWEGKVNLF